MGIIRIRISSPRIILLRVIIPRAMVSKIRQVISSRILQTAIRPEIPVISRREVPVILHREMRAISLQEIPVILHQEIRAISHQEMRAILRREILAASRRAAAITVGSMHQGAYCRP